MISKSVTDDGSDKNTFQNLTAFGISSDVGTATIQRCIFNGIQNPCSFPINDCSPSQGSAIIAQNNYGVPNLTVGGSSSMKCEFNNCSYGINCLLSVNLDAQYNTFNNSSYSNSHPSIGIYSLHSSNTTKNIVHNNFHCIDYGISMIDPNRETITIDQNNLNQSSPYPTGENQVAINVRSTRPNMDGDRLITNNVIKNYQRGIIVTNQEKNGYQLSISGNTVFMDNVSHTSGWYGIAVQAGDAHDISLNSVTAGGTGTSGIEKIFYGISVETSENNSVIENSLYNFGTGIRFYNSHIINTASCNALSGNFSHITMEGSFIGDQGSSGSASDNTWSAGTYTDDKLKAIGSPPSCIWYVQSGGSTDINSSSDILPPLYYSISPASASTMCVSPCNTPDCIQYQMARIANQEEEFSGLSDDDLYRVQKFAFETLDNDTSLMYLSTSYDSILQVFYYGLKSGNVDLFTDVKKYINANDTSDAITTNNGISTDNQSEDNEKAFNTIYLSTWAKNNFVLDSLTVVALTDIAMQNPITGGNAVYSARVMLNLDVTDTLGGSFTRHRNPHNVIYKAVTVGSGKIIPNPNTGLMRYVANQFPKSKGLLEIYNVMGNLVKSFILFPEDKQLDIDMTNYPEGVYPYRIILDNSIISYDKIILQK